MMASKMYSRAILGMGGLGLLAYQLKNSEVIAESKMSQSEIISTGRELCRRMSTKIWGESMSVPNFSGNWKIDVKRSDDEPTRVLMGKIGTPRYIVNLGMMFPATMEVIQPEDNSLVHEIISQARGMYVHNVKMFTDNREVLGKHPIDSSVIRTKTSWKQIPRTELEKCNATSEYVTCCVSEITYDKFGHRQRTIRYLEDEGKTLHIVHNLFATDGANVVAHRYMNKIDA